MISRCTVALTLLISLLALAGVRGQQNGLDPSFGDDGRVVTDVLGAADSLQGLAVESDGSIVAVGFAHRPGHSDVAIVRYSPDGELVTTRTIDLHPGEYRNDQASSIAILPDGRLIVAGVTASSRGSGNYDVMLLRLQPALDLDPTFGADGVVVTPFSGYGWVTGLALQADGRIVLSGAFGLMRYNEDGSLDASFGVGGRVSPVFSSNEYTEGVTLQADGKVLAVGPTFDTGSYELSLARFLADGSPDTTFGVKGTVFLGRHSAVPFDIAVQPDGRIVVVGGAFVEGATADFVVWRFESDGQLDASFGDGGRVFTDFGGHESAYALALQMDGRIVAAGQTSQPGDLKSANFAVGRYEANGAPDETFGVGGRAVTDFFGEYDLANVVAIQANRGVLLGGVVGNPQNGTTDFGLARYAGPPNQPPTISPPVASPNVLWPPNHRLLTVRVSYEVTDDRDPSPACWLSVASNEPVDGTGDGQTSGDWQVIDARQVRLRAERSGSGSGRLYTIVVTCSDSSGLESRQHVSVSVPHSAVADAGVFLALVAAAPADAQIGGPLFLPPVVYDSGGSSPMSVAIADLNGDRSPDIVIANAFSNSIAALINNGDATFRPAISYHVGGIVANGVVAVDVNADGNVDVLVAVRCADVVACNGLVAVLLGNGDGTLQRARTYPSGGEVGWSIASADVNRDGRLDVLVVNEASSDVGVLLGDGHGDFQPAALYESGGRSPRSVAVGDVNGDGNLDLAVANRCSPVAAGCSATGGIGVLRGNGDGTFQPPVSYGSGGDGPVSVLMSDVNGDARLDLVVANVCPAEGLLCPTGNLGLLLGQGDGTFGYPTTHAATGLGTRSAAVADVNGDGRLDLLAASLCVADQCREGVVEVFLANEGTFQFSGFYHTGANGTAAIAVADLNGDGGLDVVAANEGCADAGCTNGTAGVLLNNILPVRVAVRHGGPIGRVNVGSHARLRVVLFASHHFDVTRVDPATVRFGPAGAVPVRIRVEDVDRDGRFDVTFYFVANESGIACGDSAAALTGLTEEGLRFRGADSLVTTGCGRGRP